MKEQIKSIKLVKDLKQAGTSFVGAINRSPEGGGGPTSIKKCLGKFIGLHDFTMMIMMLGLQHSKASLIKIYCCLSIHIRM